MTASGRSNPLMTPAAGGGAASAGNAQSITTQCTPIAAVNMPSEETVKKLKDRAHFLMEQATMLEGALREQNEEVSTENRAPARAVEINRPRNNSQSQVAGNLSRKSSEKISQLIREQGEFLGRNATTLPLSEETENLIIGVPFASIDQLVNNHEELLRKLHVQATTVQARENTINQLKNQASIFRKNSQAEHSNLSKQLINARQEIKNQQEQIQNLKQRNQLLAPQAANLKRELTQAKRELEASIQKFEQTKERQTEQIQNLEQRNQFLSPQIINLTRELAQAKRELEESVQEFEQAKERQTEQIQDLEHKNHSLSLRIAHLDEEQLQAKRELEASIQKFEQTKERQTEQIQDLEHKNHSLSLRIAHLDEEQLQAKRELEASIQKFEQTKERQTEQIQDLEHKNQILSFQVFSLSEEKETFSAAYFQQEQIQRQLEVATQELEALRNWRNSVVTIASQPPTPVSSSPPLYPPERGGRLSRGGRGPERSRLSQAFNP